MSNNSEIYGAVTTSTTISVANPNLDTGGAITEVLLNGDGSGRTIKSITIKAQQSNAQGMIRLFLQDEEEGVMVLWQEIAVPANTASSINRAYQTTIYPTISLGAYSTLWASTQNAENWNIIVEAIDFSYCDCSKSTNKNQYYPVKAYSMIWDRNPNLDGTGDMVIAYEDNHSNSSIIRSITLKASQSTDPGMIRLFLGTAHGNRFLWKEIPTPANVPSAINKACEITIQTDFVIASGYNIYATTQNTERWFITVDVISWAVCPCT